MVPRKHFWILALLLTDAIVHQWQLVPAGIGVVLDDMMCFNHHFAHILMYEVLQIIKVLQIIGELCQVYVWNLC